MNELATIKKSEFAAFDGKNPVAIAMQQNLESTGETLRPSDITRVKTPSQGGLKWTIPTAAGDTVVDTIDGLLVYYQPCGVLWPSDEPSEGMLPVLRTLNPVAPDATAEQVGPIPPDMAETLEKYRIDETTYRWSDLPYNQFGSGKGGFGKRCKEQRMLFILQRASIFPVVVTAQPGSLKSVTGFFRQLAQASGGKPYWCCEISLGLEKATSKGGQVYSRIVPRLIGTISIKDGEVVKEAWTDKLAGIAHQVEAD